MEACAWLSGTRRFQCLINFFKVEGVINACGVLWDLWVSWAVWNLAWSLKIITGQHHRPGMAISVWPLILSLCLGVFWSAGAVLWMAMSKCSPKYLVSPPCWQSPVRANCPGGRELNGKKKVPSLLKKGSSLSPSLLCPHRLLWFVFWIPFVFQQCLQTKRENCHELLRAGFRVNHLSKCRQTGLNIDIFWQLRRARQISFLIPIKPFPPAPYCQHYFCGCQTRT